MKKIYIFFMSALVVYLLLSNSIILRLMNKNVAREINIDELRITQNAITTIAAYEARSNLTQDFACNGWAFSRANYKGEKKIDVILKSEKKAYIIDADTFVWDIQNGLAFPCDVVSIQNGFGIDFSTIGMKNGKYELMILTRENEEDVGLARAGKYFIKDYNGIREYIPGKINDLRSLESVDTISSAVISSYDKENQKIVFDGWAIMEGKDTQFQNVYLELRNNEKVMYYDTASYPRPDVTEVFSYNNYFYSGFRVDIPLSDLQVEDKWEMRIVIELDGLNYVAKEYLPIVIKDITGS